MRNIFSENTIAPILNELCVKELAILFKYLSFIFKIPLFAFDKESFNVDDENQSFDIDGAFQKLILGKVSHWKIWLY